MSCDLVKVMGEPTCAGLVRRGSADIPPALQRPLDNPIDIGTLQDTFPLLMKEICLRVAPSQMYSRGQLCLFNGWRHTTQGQLCDSGINEFAVHAYGICTYKFTGYLFHYVAPSSNLSASKNNTVQSPYT